MKLNTLFFFAMFSMLTLPSIPSFAAGASQPSIECKARPWAGKANPSIRNISTTLEMMPRTDVIQLVWGEVLKTDQSQSFAFPVLQFLIGTETRTETRGYFKSLAMMMTSEQILPSEAIKTWPKRPKAHPVPIQLTDLCQMYNQSARK